MPVVSTKAILEKAFAERYGVAAFNVVNDLTMEAGPRGGRGAAVAGDRPDVGETRGHHRGRRDVCDVRSGFEVVQNDLETL